MPPRSSLPTSAGSRRPISLRLRIVIDGSRDPIASRRFDDLIREAQLVIEPVTEAEARIAREAYRDFGKGRGHPAKLNFGDCFAYALAKSRGEPLLYKGDDFKNTDISARQKIAVRWMLAVALRHQAAVSRNSAPTLTARKKDDVPWCGREQRCAATPDACISNYADASIRSALPTGSYLPDAGIGRVPGFTSNGEVNPISFAISRSAGTTSSPRSLTQVRRSFSRCGDPLEEPVRRARRRRCPGVTPPGYNAAS